MKRILLSLLLLTCMTTLIACQSQNNDTINKVTEVSFSTFSGYGALNEHYFLTFNEEETLLRIEDILNHSISNNQRVDTDKITPKYDILIRYENGGTRGLHLLLGNAGEESLLMSIGYEKTFSYIVSPKDTDDLRKILGL